MEAQKKEGIRTEDVKSISNALEVLNQAAGESADDLRAMMRRDYQQLRNIFDGVRPTVKKAVREMEESTVRSLSQVRDTAARATKNAVSTVDRSAHDHPWAYLGAATAGAALIGFLFGRRTRTRGTNRIE